MQVLKRSSTGYKEDPTKYFEFDTYSKTVGDFVLVEAAFEEAHQWEQFGLSDQELKAIFKKKIVRLEFEEPNKFFLKDRMELYDEHFYKIFTICPYTAEWLNKKYNNKRRIPIFFPFNKKYIPSNTTKKYDIIYTGHIVSNKLLHDLEILSKFNYRFVSNSQHSLVTNRGASYQEKMKLISQSKITLVQNLLYPKLYHIFNVWRTKGYQDSKAFINIPPWYKPWKLLQSEKIVVPQLKSRLFEAAFSKSLILCKKDQFNIIEDFFEPGKEFIYFEGDLEEKIKEILQNYKHYEPIIERAYNKAMKYYTTDAFVSKFLKPIA